MSVDSFAPKLEEAIDYNPNVGVEGVHIWGAPGSGKSNLATYIAWLCMERQGDKLLLRGDRFCEWQHYLNRGRQITLWIPKEAKGKWQYSDSQYEDLIKDAGVEIVEDEGWNEFNIMRHLRKDDVDILVMHDICFPLALKGWFWAKIFLQLINRIQLIDQAICFLDHEAGVLLPEIALSESKEAGSHWKAVNRICEYFVDFRKALVRPILISQLEGEINWRLRQKCMFTIVKKGTISTGFPEDVRELGVRQAIDEYILVSARKLYRPHNKARKFPEHKPRIKMIPTEYIPIPETEKKQPCDWTPMAERARVLGLSYDNIAYIVERDKATVYRRLKR